MNFSKEILIRNVKFFNGPKVELKTYVIVDNLKNYFIRYATEQDIMDDDLRTKRLNIEQSKKKLEEDF